MNESIAGYEPIEVAIRGFSPLMLHNGQLVDPLNRFSKAMKEITSKRNKTDDDYRRLADLEWEGSLYLDAEERVVVPGENIEGMLADAGAKHKCRDAVRMGVICDGLWRLEYDGPTDLDALRADARFRDKRRVPVKQSAVIRCRPIFVPWALAFTVHFLPDVLSEDRVIQLLNVGGRIIGLGDYTPKYGRFEVVSAGRVRRKKAG